MKRLFAIGGLVLLAALALAVAICRFTPLNCHLRESEQDYFRGLAGYGKGSTLLPSGFAQDVVVSGLTLPTSFAFLPDGRILVAEKQGRVWLVGRGRLVPRPLLDLRRRVNTFGYRGLLTIEPDPEFSRRPYLYFLYVREDRSGPSDGPRTVRVSRVRVRGDRAVPRTEEVLLGTAGRGSCNDLPRGSDCIPCDGDHCGGDLEFASDGTMFISTGDGWNGSAGFNANTLRAQQLDSLGGKLLRVTRDGRGLPSNPFWTGEPVVNRSKIWASGLRNPFRFTLRTPGDTPYLGDVGWNTWEEVNVVTPGGNLGWPCLEGNVRPAEYRRHPVCRSLYRRGATLRPPLVIHHRGSVTGGTFLSGTAFPSEYEGAYVYGDWSRSWLRVVRVNAQDEILGPPRRFAANTAGPVQLEIGPDGSLYYLATNAGELRRVYMRR